MDYLLILLALLLVLLNGFFVASEFAIVKLRGTRVEALRKVYGIRGAVLSKVHRNMDAYLSACQLGITLSSLGLGWIGEPAFARLLEPIFSMLGITSPKVIHISSFAVAFFIISYLHIVVGELAPKSMAIRRPETMSLWTAIPLYLFYWGMYPLIYVLNASANWMLTKAGLDTIHEHEHSYSADELKLILRSSRATSLIKSGKWDILVHVLDFSEMTVRDILKPSGDLVAVYSDLPVEQNLQTISLERFSRHPMIEKSTQKLLGILHVKDMIGKQIKTNEDLIALLRPPLLINDKTPAIEVLKKFRFGDSAQFAIVPDTSGIAGFLTFDDLLSVFLGDIQDEFRREAARWKKLKGGMYRGNASLPIYTLERLLGIDIPSDAGSVSGLIMEKLQRLPDTGEIVDFRYFQLKVLSMRGPRILNVKIIPKTTALDQDD